MVANIAASAEMAASQAQQNTTIEAIQAQAALQHLRAEASSSLQAWEHQLQQRLTQQEIAMQTQFQSRLLHHEQVAQHSFAEALAAEREALKATLAREEATLQHNHQQAAVARHEEYIRKEEALVHGLSSMATSSSGRSDSRAAVLQKEYEEMFQLLKVAEKALQTSEKKMASELAEARGRSVQLEEQLEYERAQPPRHHEQQDEYDDEDAELSELSFKQTWPEPPRPTAPPARQKEVRGDPGAMPTEENPKRTRWVFLATKKKTNRNEGRQR